MAFSISIDFYWIIDYNFPLPMSHRKIFQILNSKLNMGERQMTYMYNFYLTLAEAEG